MAPPLLTVIVVLPWLLLGFGCWLGYQLVRQNGRILVRLEALESNLEQIGGRESIQAPAGSTGLPLGLIAPAFELPDLTGNLRGLLEFRGRPVLLIFFSPHCGFCTEMVPDLAALARDEGNSQPMPLVVTTGDLATNVQLFQKHGVRCPVLLQEDMVVASQYHAHGTPTGYLIDEQGAIASNLTAGASALLALGIATDERYRPQTPKAAADKSLVNSRLNRGGLEAGAPAPSFRLLRVDGGDLALEDYRGRHVLLIFSDPNCGPCDQLAPHLEQLHRDRGDLQVLMVSRQDVETNRQKVAKLGLTFPVVLQKNWEVSLLYAMFATPIAYLIDDQGIITTNVAIGVQPILDLASSASVSNNGHRKQSLVRPDSGSTSQEQNSVGAL